MADASPFEAVARAVDPTTRLLHAEPLTGGISATVTALTVERADGRTERWVVRQHGERDLRGNSHIARDEFRLLQIAAAHNLPVPPPIAVDETGAILGSPYLIVGFVDGEDDFEPDDLSATLRQMADALAAIHAIPDIAPLAFLPRSARGYRPASHRLDDALQEGRIRAALDAHTPAAANSPTLLHGDYWPGNILWKSGRIAAIIDWEDAALGDPLADLATARLEIFWWFGEAARDNFTAHYLTRATSCDPGNLPYWDLVAALRPCGKLADFGLDADTERTFRERHAAFVDAAIEQIAAG